jgi:hypothetical protein
MASIQELPNDFTSDKTGPACYKCLHKLSLANKAPDCLFFLSAFSRWQQNVRIFFIPSKKEKPQRT